MTTTNSSESTKKSRVACCGARAAHYLRSVTRKGFSAIKRVTCDRSKHHYRVVGPASASSTSVVCGCQTGGASCRGGGVCSCCDSGRSGRFLNAGSLAHLICLNMLVCGIEFCASAGFTYIPPMLLKAGFRESFMTCVMGVGPFIALICVPVLGRWSDRCQSSLGRRRPFILGISSITIVSLVLIAYGQAVGAAFAPGLKLGVVLLVTGVITLDFCCHAGFNPCEALVADMVKKSSNKEQGFTVYSNMVSLGGCIGYLISAVDWTSSYGSQEQTAFSFILILFIPSLIITMIVAEDRQRIPVKPLRTITSTTQYNYPPDKIDDDLTVDAFGYDDIGYETGSNDSQENIVQAATPSPLLSSRRTLLHLPHGGGSSGVLRRLMRYGELSQCAVTSLTSAVCGGPRRALADFGRSVRRFLDVPITLRRLFVSDFCSWTALMCHNMYYSDYVGQAVYGGNPVAEENSISRQLYDRGIRMGSIGLLLHSITSIMYASCLQKRMLKWCGMQMTYLFGLAVFTFTMVATMMTSNLTVINLMAALSGTGFAAITTIPYMLVTAYHSDKDLYLSEGTKASAIKATKRELEEADEAVVDDSDCDSDDDEESRGFGGDIAILDAAYFLSQIVLSLIVGTLVDLTHSVSTYLVVSATFGFIACYCSTKVVFPPNAGVTRTQEQ